MIPDDEEIRTVLIGPPKKEWGQFPQVVLATTRHERRWRNLAGWKGSGWGIEATYADMSITYWRLCGDS